MNSPVLTIISFLIIFTVVVVSHEFGHFLIARINGIRVLEFSIGMGPVLFRKKGKNTRRNKRKKSSRMQKKSAFMPPHKPPVSPGRPSCAGPEKQENRFHPYTTSPFGRERKKQTRRKCRMQAKSRQSVRISAR